MKVPILMYHAVHPEPSVISIRPDIFERQMEWLKSHDFRIIALRELGVRLASGEDIPARTVVITFDDGYECLYEHAIPILVRMGFPATIFLVVNHCEAHNDWPGQPSGVPHLPLLSWQQIRSLDAGLIEFGSHTLSHPRLDQVNGQRLRDEICLSRKKIEDRLGREVTSFCYPYGRVSTEADAIVRSAYLLACSTRTGLVTSSSDPYQLERVEIAYLVPSVIFAGLEQSWLQYYLLARGVIRSAAARLFHRQWN